MPSLDFELFGEESDSETSPQLHTPTANTSQKRKADNGDHGCVAGSAKKKRVGEAQMFDSKDSINSKHSPTHSDWAPFQVSDDPKATRQTNTGKDIPTNGQLKIACANGTIGIDFNDHNQLRAWLKIHKQPSSGNYAALVERVEDYLDAHGEELDDWYSTVKAKQKKPVVRTKKRVQTKADVLARAQKAFEEASRLKV
ncbi:hypothetical protein Slin15195_G096800 [Septoria linicola]|uniref:Uncharacterized protein n=1 Tax=Septoria linicola TaxID=215465 RepID=A0A9Q9B343_9PEZI|nr:hypothetical protein Slin14017_G059890 [Septoria linicola]USW56361.1 hypothetical protein Slin15195_G096800 [Septoria linicola]